MRQRTRVKEENRESVPQDGCHHYWIIEVANGPTSRGICKYCGEEKEFLNTMPDFSDSKRGRSLLDLPKLRKVEIEKDSKS